MKKNRMMRLASILLVCVLMTTSVISGTFAKYVTTDNDTDTARVAKWGVNVDVTVDGAFASEYDAAATVTDGQGKAIAKTVVASNNTDNLLAPGTKGDLLKNATVSGTPEVAVKVTKTADLKLTGWTALDGSYYCPLKITVINGSDSQVFNGMDAKYVNADNTVNAFIYDVENALNLVENYGPNTNLNANQSVEWEWVFENGVGQDNIKDTQLGNAAVKSDIKIEFSYVITVEQID